MGFSISPTHSFANIKKSNNLKIRMNLLFSSRCHFSQTLTTALHGSSMLWRDGRASLWSWIEQGPWCFRWISLSHLVIWLAYGFITNLLVSSFGIWWKLIPQPLCSDLFREALIYCKEIFFLTFWLNYACFENSHFLVCGDVLCSH
jgi:hypothetical protein